MNVGKSLPILMKVVSNQGLVYAINVEKQWNEYEVENLF